MSRNYRLNRPKKTVLTPEDGLKKLQKQLEDEKNARVAAENRAREAANAEASARGEVQKSQLDLIKGAIDQANQQGDVLERELATAMAAQDFAAVAKAQRALSKNEARIAQLEGGKTALENAPPPKPKAPVDQVEAYIASIGNDYPRSREWLRAHPEFVRNKQLNDQMIAAHNLALARGHKADSDDYFKSIEKTLDLTLPGEHPITRSDDPADDPTEAAAKPVNGGRQAAPAAAPVTRSGNGNGSRPNVVKLSPAEVEMAQNMGMSVEDYARNKMALRKEGKLS